MNIGKMTKMAPVTLGYRIDPELPVIILTMEVERVGCAASHAHPRGQLIYAESGSMRVVCGRDIWIVPPSQAVWVPPGIEHEVYFPGRVSLLNLFIDPSAAVGMPESCVVVKVSSLLRELLRKAAYTGDDYRRDSVEWRLIQVLIDELRQAEPTLLHLPQARDPRVLFVIEALLKNPGNECGLNEWGKMAGASGRTLARLFVLETGLTFGAWRRRLLLQRGIDRLYNGDSVTTVAFDLGYRSMSAFIEMFRRTLGTSPGQYIRYNRHHD
jgi:AraC-like DNA-binding protein/mannose-6-phosphate isomerase-like protein (cupin superfamily)